MSNKSNPNLAKVAATAQVCFERFLKGGSKYLRTQPDLSGRTGGLLSVRHPDGIPHLVLILGEIPEEKVGKYYDFSLEKGFRLSLNASPPLCHLSSWESRDPEKNKWGGAIVAGDTIFSFSGFPELVDEAFSLYIAWALRLLTADEVFKIARISQNRFVLESFLIN